MKKTVSLRNSFLVGLVTLFVTQGTFAGNFCFDIFKLKPQSRYTSLVGALGYPNFYMHFGRAYAEALEKMGFSQSILNAFDAPNLGNYGENSNIVGIPVPGSNLKVYNVLDTNGRGFLLEGDTDKVVKELAIPLGYLQGELNNEGYPEKAAPWSFYAVFPSADGSKIIGIFEKYTAQYSQQVGIVWDTKTGLPITYLDPNKKLSINTGSFEPKAFDLIGNLLVIITNSSQAIIFNTDTGQKIKTFSLNRFPFFKGDHFTAVSFIEDGKKIVVTTDQGENKIFAR